MFLVFIWFIFPATNFSNSGLYFSLFDVADVLCSLMHWPFATFICLLLYIRHRLTANLCQTLWVIPVSPSLTETCCLQTRRLVHPHFCWQCFFWLESSVCIKHFRLIDEAAFLTLSEQSLMYRFSNVVTFKSAWLHAMHHPLRNSVSVI